MNKLVQLAIDAFFVVAVMAPPLLVLIYRVKDVPLRRSEIASMMKTACENPDELKRALDNNPYISDPMTTFDRYHKPLRYFFPLLVLAVLTTCSTYIIYSWIEYRLAPPPPPISTQAPASIAAPAALASSAAKATDSEQPIAARLPLVIIMALAGGYVWSVFEIFSRIRASELSPPDLYEIAIGLLAAVPIGIAFSLVTTELDHVRSFMAFAASAFPLREASRMIRQYATRKMLDSSASTATSRPAERHLGTSIEGLSDETLARLSELQITTVLDMAYCDPFEVMVQTGFPLPVIIDWMDQSIWALYIGDLKPDINRCGIRCSLDVCEFVCLHLRDDAGKKKEVLTGADKDALDALSAKICSQVLLQDLFFRICNDPQVVFLRILWYPHGVPKELHA
jgi:hypothetical protein